MMAACPSCGMQYQLHRTFQGRSIACSRCKNIFRVVGQFPGNPGIAPGITPIEQAQVETRKAPPQGSHRSPRLTASRRTRATRRQELIRINAGRPSSSSW